MYIVYWKKTGYGPFTIEIREDCESPEYAASVYPSECQWIVPGTIDPKED